MSHKYSLAFLTCSEVPPDEAVSIAAKAGYDMVGLRFLPAAPTEAPYPVLTDPALQDSVARALQVTGISLADIEIARLGPKTEVGGFRPFLALGQKLGARHVLVAGDDAEPERMTATYAAFCDLAADHGLTADLEFMPWTGVKTLAAARAIVSDAGRANGGVLIDALHWDRSGGTAEEIRALPPELIHYAQVCDGPAHYDRSDAGMIEIARAARVTPGAGGIPLTDFVGSLPDETVISVEVPQLARAARVAPLNRARELLAATQTIVAGAAQDAASDRLSAAPEQRAVHPKQ